MTKVANLQSLITICGKYIPAYWKEPKEIKLHQLASYVTSEYYPLVPYFL